MANLTSQEDPLGFVTSFSVDEFDRVQTITYPDDDEDPENNPTVVMTYDDASNVITHTNERGSCGHGRMTP